jgi:hypothetical protein
MFVPELLEKNYSNQKHLHKDQKRKSTYYSEPSRTPHMREKYDNSRGLTKQKIFEKCILYSVSLSKIAFL